MWDLDVSRSGCTEPNKCVLHETRCVFTVLLQGKGKNHYCHQIALFILLTSSTQDNINFYRKRGCVSIATSSCVKGKMTWGTPLRLSRRLFFIILFLSYTTNNTGDM